MDKPPLQIKRPMELAGLKSRLQRANFMEKDIAVTGKRYDVVLDEIDELHKVSKDHVGGLEMYKGDLRSTIERMVGGSNGDPNDDGQDGQTSGDQIKPEAAKVDGQAEVDAKPAIDLEVTADTLPRLDIVSHEEEARKVEGAPA